MCALLLPDRLPVRKLKSDALLSKTSGLAPSHAAPSYSEKVSRTHVDVAVCQSGCAPLLDKYFKQHEALSRASE